MLKMCPDFSKAFLYRTVLIQHLLSDSNTCVCPTENWTRFSIFLGKAKKSFPSHNSSPNIAPKIRVGGKQVAGILAYSHVLYSPN